MEEKLLVQQTEYEKRTPKANTILWLDRFSRSYEKLCEDSSPLEAFSKLITIKREVEQKLEKAKNTIDSFSTNLKSILINEKKIESGSYVEKLHRNISLNCLLTFTSSTIGNFMYGGMNMGKAKKELKRMKKEFPDHSESFKSLSEIVREYVQKTEQKRQSELSIKIPKAFELRFLADKLYYQQIALDILVHRIFLHDYPSKLPILSSTERERLNRFLLEKGQKRRTTPPELYQDIYLLINRLKQRRDEHLFKKGKLVYSVAAQYALDEKDEEALFAKKWKHSDINPEGVSKTWLEKKIKEIYEEVIAP